MALATLLGILGSSISESALGLTFMDIIRTETRKLYFNSIRMLLWLPTLILSAIGAFIAFQFGLKVLFLGLAIIQIGLVFPLYFALLIIESRKKVIL
jgi:beta-lactamase regulating signal transducer with metallopeptidase domain